MVLCATRPSVVGRELFTIVHEGEIADPVTH